MDEGILQKAFTKAVNHLGWKKQHGHPIGDEVLQSISQSISACTLRKGNAYRYGGDEVVVLLPHFCLEEAVAFAERMRRQIELSTHSSKKLKITCSLGVASMPQQTKDSREMLTFADKALYAAKNLGRNCVRFHGDPASKTAEPRKPSKKEPPPNRITEQQEESIRLQFFRKGGAQCPKDGAWLDIQQSHQRGFKTPDLFVFCPVCGLNGELPGLQ